MKLHKILTQQICTRNLRKLLYEILDSVSPSLVIFRRWRRRQFCRKEALSSVDRRERRKERKQLTFCCRCSTIAFLIHSRPHSGSLKPRFGRCSIVILRAYRASLVMSWSTYTHNNNNNNKLLISAPSLGVYYFFCRWLCLSQTLILLFCLSMESSHFWPSVLHDKNYKTLFFDFWFRPPTPKIYSPKFAQNRL